MNNASSYRWLWIGAVALLSWLSYGDVVGRGLYADDFVFGWLSQSHTYWDAVRYWHEVAPAGDRLFLAILTPFVYGLFCSRSLLESHLGAFHVLLVAIHLANTVLLWLLLRRYRLRPLASGTGALLFLLHPAKNRAVLWPAAAYGYGIPLLLFLLGWHCVIKTERTRPVVAIVGYGLWIAAALSIEQFVMVEVGLLLVWSLHEAVRSRRWTRLHAAHLTAAVVLCCVFFGAHFGLGDATSKRLATYDARLSHAEPTGLQGWLSYVVTAGKIVVWRLNPLPSHSAHEEAWSLVREGIGHPILFAGLGAVVAGFALALWPAPPARGEGGWAVAEGAVLAVTALIPFLLLGMGAGPPRGMLLVMVGLALVVGGVVEEGLACARSGVAARATVAAAVVLFAALATVANAGYQAGYRQVWAMERGVLQEVATHAWQEGDRVIVEGLPKGPLFAQLFEDSWGLYHALRWITHLDDIDGWTPRMKEPRPESAPGHLVTIHVQGSR